MKKLALLFALVFAAGVAVADEKPAAAAPKAPTAASGEKAAATPAKTHEVEAEIVAVDAAKHTLTLKGETENKTVPVEGKAVAALKDVKVGSKVTLTCKDDDKGAHQAVVAIKPAAEKK
jgi:hypothetical protein